MNNKYHYFSGFHKRTIIVRFHYICPTVKFDYRIDYKTIKIMA